MVKTYTLDNGLTVLLKEVHHAPIVSFWVLYRVGSRNEPTGKTGISHWCEHMLFKGTEKFPAGILDRVIDRSGGNWNAYTSLDYTMYFETMPADKIDLALELEADRMVNAAFDAEEVESERTVIISERQGSENSPMFWLEDTVHSTAFLVHGYHHEILGDMADLETMTRDDLYNHYRKHYVPSNAVVIAAGAFDTDDMLAHIKQHFGAIPSGDRPQLFVRSEPEQQGERRVIVERPGNTAFLKMSHRAPDATHEDWFKLDILDSILTGPGGEVDNKTSRLYQALVKSEIAAGMGGGLTETIDPYLYSITVTLRDGRTPEEAETVLKREIMRVIQEGVTEGELKKAKKQARAAFAYDSESITDQAYWLGVSAALDDIDWANNYISRVESVTLEDIQDVASRYLTSRGRTVGWLIPTGVEEEE